MGFQSVNEIEKFSFDDCQINDFKITDDTISMELEALIVRRNNTQNTNFTDSYAGTTDARLFGANVIKVIKDGYKYYDANEVLVSEVPDRELSGEEMGNLLRGLKGAYLYFMERDGEEQGLFYYTLGVEFVDREDNTMSDSYSICVSFERAVFSWERYMNRVQQ